jgi:hypothetical protein
MKSVEQYVEMYRSTVQAAVTEEQVLAVGIMTPPGTMKSVLVSQGSPLIGMIMRRKGKKASGGFPMNFLMAVTPTRLITFGYKPRGTKIKLEERLTEWPRRHVRVELGQSGMSQRMRFTFSDGQTIEADALRSLGQYDRMNDPFFASLGLVRTAAA